MSGWSILIAGLVLGNVVYILLTLTVARVFGLRPPQAMLGLLWRPLTITLLETDIHIGPLPLNASVVVDIAGDAGGAERQAASPLVHAVLAGFAFVVLLLAGFAVAGADAMAAVVAALKAYVTLPLHLGTPMNLGDMLAGLALDRGPVAAVAVVIAVMAAINLIPLPPFAGSAVVEGLVAHLRGRPVATDSQLLLLKLNLAWLLVLAVTLVVRHLGG